ncbi:DUF2283 domain-containing protein [Candidatus Acetothermia bacterium]|jgi:uncharacterized protein YuzE|nr:DUF2283 domain-containing protein [Candidatus Acetothermia bacterium]MCI2432299.1 DUF2283 domain-containing protein [Candidatus Acetothermia bacterium]MCI2437424.1 DUF2283 domain-containing protein [Candidatus Acetothermia bacterium]
MAAIDVKEILSLAPRLLNIPYKRIWYSYDEEADVLYLNFKKPSHADDSELTDDDILIRYEKGEVVGITVLHASTRRTVAQPS